MALRNSSSCQPTLLPSFSKKTIKNIVTSVSGFIITSYSLYHPSASLEKRFTQVCDRPGKTPDVLPQWALAVTSHGKASFRTLWNIFLILSYHIILSFFTVWVSCYWAIPLLEGEKKTCSCVPSLSSPLVTLWHMPLTNKSKHVSTLSPRVSHLIYPVPRGVYLNPAPVTQQH